MKNFILVFLVITGLQRSHRKNIRTHRRRTKQSRSPMAQDYDDDQNNPGANR